MSTWIYVTNLPLYYDDLTLKDIFSGIGQIESIKLSKDELILKSTALIEFTHSKHAKLAASKKDQTVISKSAIRVYLIWTKKENLSTIKAFGIPKNAKETDLEKYFNPYGNIVDIQICDKYALISFSRVDYALQAAQEMDGTIIPSGDVLRVQLTNPDARNLQWKRHSFEYISLKDPEKMQMFSKDTYKQLHQRNGRSPRNGHHGNNNITNKSKNNNYRTYNVGSPRERRDSSSSGSKARNSTSPRSTAHASSMSMSTTSPRNHVTKSINAPIQYPSTELIVDLIIYGYMRKNLLIPRNMRHFIIPTQITLITSRYFYKDEPHSHSQSTQNGDNYNNNNYHQTYHNGMNGTQPLYLSNPNVPAPPSRNPPQPPLEQKEMELKMRQNQHLKPPQLMNAMPRSRSIEGKYQQIFDIYRDRLESIESKMVGLNGQFITIQDVMNNTLMSLENRRINDIKTIQSQFNNTITALCYQINAQINNQIKLLTTKLDNNRKYSGDKIEELQNKLLRLQKENDSLRKQRKIDKILKLNGSQNGSAPPSPTKSAISAPDSTNDINIKLELDEIQKVKDWLCDIVKLPQYFDLFIEHGYDDLETLSDLTMEELQHIGVEKRGHRKKMLKHAVMLRDNITPLSHHELTGNWTGQPLARNGHHQNGHQNGHSNVRGGGDPALSPNSANGGPSNSTVSGHSAHSSLYSHNIWSEHDSNDNMNIGGNMNGDTHNIPWGAYSANGHNNNGSINQNQ